MPTSIKNSYSCDFETLVLTKEELAEGKETYVWAWASCKIFDNPTDNVRIGNTIESFFDYVKTLKKPTLYFHNLKFDGSFILNYLYRNGYQNKKNGGSNTFETIISKMGQWYMIKIVFEEKNKKKKYCTIYDSLKKLPFSVDEIAKAFDLGEHMQKLKLDYERYRPYGYQLTEEEKEYIRHDVIIVAKALKMQFDEGMTRMTNGSDSLGHYQELFGKNEFRKYFPVLSEEVDTMLRPSYKGGYVYCNKTYAKISEDGQIGKCVVIDKNSMHPSMMCTKPMPYGLPMYFEGEYTGNEKLYIQHLRCRFKVKDRYVPTIQIKKNMMYNDTEYLEQSRIDDIIDEDVDLYLPSPDLEIFFKHYHVWDIEFVDGFAFKSMTGYFFNDYINQLMEIKERETGVKRLMAKLKMNSLYGKFGTNPDVTGKETYYEDGTLKFRKPTDEYYDMYGNVYVEEVKETRDPVYLPVGIFITAWSRWDIINAIDKVNDDYINHRSDIDRFIYCDTDSVHMLGWDVPKGLNIHDTHLDCWAIESYNVGAKYLRQKTYIDKVACLNEKDMKKYEKVKASNPQQVGFENGYYYYLDIKCAGMPNNIKSEMTYDSFKVGFKSNNKLIGHQVKGGVVLLRDKFEIKAKN